MIRKKSQPVIAQPFIKYTVITAPLLLAMALYGYTIGLPLFLDDGPQFRMVEVFTGFDQWLGSPAYFYYRPAVFSMWKLSSILAGFYDAAGLHWLNVMLFGMTGVLLSAFAYRLLPIYRIWGALGVGVGFVIFPFSYQAVTLVGAMFHTSMIFCTMLTLWCGMLWWERAKWHWLIIASISAFLGIFSHENGVFIAPLMLLVLWTGYGIKALLSRRMLVLMLPLIGITALYLLAYVTVPRAPSVGGVQSIESMIQAFSIMVQSAAYPLSALLNPLVAGVPSPFVTIGLGMGVLFGGLVIVVWRAPMLWRMALFGVVWYLMALLPTVILLDQSYVDGSPRILIFASMGLHLFYVCVLSALWRASAHTSIFTRPLVIIICVLMVMVSLPFIHTRREYFDLLNGYMRDLHQFVRNQSADAPILLVNAPDYITPLDADRTFLRGSEGAAMMFHLVDYDRQIWVNTGILPRVQTAKFGELNHAQGYSLYAHDPEVSADVLRQMAFENRYLYVTQFDPDGRRFYPVYVGTPHRSGEVTLQVLFGDVVALITGEAVYHPQKRAVLVHLRWHVLSHAPVKPFVHVMCDGQLVGQIDSHVWGGIYPFDTWSIGEAQTEYRQIPISRAYDPQVCAVYAGVYHQQTIERLPATHAIRDESYADALVPLDYRGVSDAPFPFD